MLGNFPVPGRPFNLDNSRSRPTLLTVGAGGIVWTFFLSSYHFTFLSPSLSGLKNCLKGPLSSKRSTYCFVF